MSAQKKPRADATLKTLPADRQAVIAEYAREHSLTETRAWLAEDGLQTSEAALSGWLSSWRLQQQLQRNGSTVEQLLADLKSAKPDMTPEQLDVAGQMFFTALAIEQQDSLAWKRAQDAKAKLGMLEISRQQFQRDTLELFIKWHADKQAQEVLRSTSTNADKIERLGQIMFGDDWK